MREKIPIIVVEGYELLYHAPQIKLMCLLPTLRFGKLLKYSDHRGLLTIGHLICDYYL